MLIGFHLLYAYLKRRIVAAKRDETRDNRMAQTEEWMAEGKRRHWKYENC